jgi:hypothetical protein
MPSILRYNAMAVAVALLLGLAGVLIAIDQFRLGEALLVSAGVWLFVWVAFLDYFASPFDTRRDVQLWTIFLLICGVMFSLGRLIEGYRTDKILSANSGLLLPANDYMANVCGDLTNDYRILWLGTTPTAISTFPHTAVVATLLDNNTRRAIPLISVNLINGLLSVSANVTSSDGKTISTIDNNHWVVNQNNILLKENPDVSSMIVTDKYKKRVLYVRFMNERLIKIYALFRINNHELEFNESGVFIDHSPKLSYVCIKTSGPGVPLEVNF